ncbi:MAG: hypothetical protein HY005_02130 [Candidatus Staskawiczbacteria bacterium]|nr:hypothetical protein [Candidatus Staskawiczbacteria bacterium]
MNERGFIKNIVIIIVILTVIFLGQQTYFKEYGRNLYSQIKPQVQAYWTGISDWFKNNVYSGVSGEVEQKSALIQQEVEKQKNNLMQNIWEKIKDYFGNIFSKVSGTPVK